MSEKTQPTEKQILTVNPAVGSPDLIYCPDVLPAPWQGHPRPCPGPQGHLLCDARQLSHPLSPVLNSCLLLALHATRGVLKSIIILIVIIKDVYLAFFCEGV